MLGLMLVAYFLGLLISVIVTGMDVLCGRDTYFTEKYGAYRGMTLLILYVFIRVVLWPIFLVMKYIIGMIKGK